MLRRWVGGAYANTGITSSTIRGIPGTELRIKEGTVRRPASQLILELGHKTCHLVLQDLELLDGGALEILVQLLQVTRVVE